MNFNDYLFNIISLIRFLIAIIILFILFPKLILKTKNSSDFIESFFVNFIKMSFFYIIIGYILVFTKLYELLSILTIIFILFINKTMFSKKINDFEGLKDKFYMSFYKFLDDFIHPINGIKKLVEKNSLKISKLFRPYSILNKLPFLFVFGLTIYFRFYDSILHSAPGLSDSYVTLEWMKNIDRREIFKTGIYPQGFHIILATINKIAANDALFMIKYMGPFNGFLTTISIFFFILKVTGSRPPALLSAFLFGVLGWVISDWTRQAATNSQEFAIVFIFPTLYFYYKFLSTKDILKNNTYTANHNLIIFFAGTAVIGLIHTLAFFYFVIAVIAMTISFLIIDFKGIYKSVLKALIYSIIASIISVIPIGIGLLLKYEFHSSSVEYLEATLSNFSLTQLKLIDYISIISIIIIFIFTISVYKKFNFSKIMPILIFSIIFGVTAFIIYFAGGVLTKSVVISSRSDILWLHTVPIIIGITWCLISCKIPDSSKSFSIKCLLTTFIILTTTIVIKSNPDLSKNLKPILPYKMEWDSSINQYYRIKNTFPTKEWLHISNIEGYSVVLGSGFHMLQENFLKNFNPEDKYIYSLNSKNKIPHTFIYIEKNVFKVEKTNSIYSLMEPIYNQREINYKKMNLWVKKYKTLHNNAKIFYEDKHILIYHIEQEKNNDDLSKDIWDHMKLRKNPKEVN